MESSSIQNQEHSFNVTYKSENNIQFHICNDSTLKGLSEFPGKKYNRFFVIFDDNVEKIWGQKMLDQIRVHNKDVFVYKVPAIEDSKSVNYYLKLVNFLESEKCGRFDLVIAIGGGIVLDLVSFTASIYMRGLPFYAVPTTIIGQVDAITAGKTCLNTNNSKNLLGSFYYPLYVYNNISILETNSNYYHRQGFSEVFKYAVLGSKELLNEVNLYLGDKEQNSDRLFRIILGTIECRSNIRKKDPLASNLGHTFGHAIEKMTDYKVLHGDAISVGTVMALYFAVEEGILRAELRDWIVDNMKRNGLNIYMQDNIDVENMVQLMLRDKKSSHNKINLVLVTDLAQHYHKEDFYFYSTSPDRIKEFISSFMEDYSYKTSNLGVFLRKDNIIY